jgi:hypothetical protein
VFLFASLVFSASQPVHAQGGAHGAISGVVVDSSGSTVADAEVQIIATATESVVRKINTTTDGSFVGHSYSAR